MEILSLVISRNYIIIIIIIINLFIINNFYTKKFCYGFDYIFKKKLNI